MKPRTEHPFSHRYYAVVEAIRAALVVAATLPPDEQHMVREAIAQHLLDLGGCQHGLAD